ncbi:MAG: hypothetical protein HY874_06355 [Chloroflexi bacterium]|nr:hypothetical protein [Chloroflexota bacterium]
MRLLKIDPRPPSYDSVAEAALDAGSNATIVDSVEMQDWHPIAPPPVVGAPKLAFVDGVQRLEVRVSAEGDGWPIPGALVSYAAGAACPGREPPVRHVNVQRRVILAKGVQPSSITLSARNGELDYLPAHNAGEDFESLGRTLNDLRANLEAEVVRALIVEGMELIIADGRLPDVRHGPVVGLIKTLHDLYVSKPEQVDCLMRLRAGERSPLFLIQRARTTYYSWFICLRDPGPLDLALSGLARLEMDDAKSKDEVLRVADITASILPAYASTAARDDRAPQNLLPVGQLERELRHRLGDPELLKRLMVQTFAKESPGWNP